MACTETFYIQSATSLKEKLNRYDQIIEALELRALDAVGSAEIDEYELDDGQVKIRTKYRNPTAIVRAIEIFQRLRNKCYNELNGYGFALRDKRGLAL